MGSYMSCDHDRNTDFSEWIDEFFMKIKNCDK